MADLKRDYIINLRKEIEKVPRYKKTSKAMKGLRKFILKNMKVDEVKILPELNEFIFSQGRKNPPTRVEVTCLKIEDKDKSIARANLKGHKVEPEEKKEKKGLEKLKDKITGKDKEEKTKEDVLEHKETKEIKEKEIKKFHLDKETKETEKPHAHRKQEKVIGTKADK
ncbi:MAG: 50S ribosomal protein L31e [Candidatus Nanoarchaeia archaeon]|nr:50S ribosomal protein L31e [Candidatus Nanoarchaeia archaeon]